MTIFAPSRGFRRVLRWLFVVALGWTAGARAADPAAPAGGDVVTLPPLIVEWKNAPLRWRYLELPGFELLTVCGDETAADFARRNRRLGELLHALVPGQFLFRSAVPEIHVLFNEETGRARSQEVIAEMVKAQGAKVESDGKVRLHQPDAPLELELPGILRGMPLRPRQPRQIFFLPNLRLGDPDSLAVFSIAPDNTSSLTFGYAEDRVRFLLEARTPALPEWYVAGVLGLFRRAEFGQNEVVLQPLIWRSAAESRALAYDRQRPRVLLPVADLLAGRRPAPGTTLTETDEIWAAQCALFVRWALAEEKGSRREALEKFVARLDCEAPTEALFQECFGLDFSDVRDRLSDYLPEAVDHRAKLPVPASPRAPKIVPRPATAAEIARIRGNWERREIAYVRAQHPYLVDNYIAQARATLHRAYDTGERDPGLLAEMALTELEAGDPEAARRLLEAAGVDGLVRPLALFELARLRYEAVPADQAVLTSEQAAAVQRPLRAALKLEPPLRGAYVLLAALATRSATAPDAAELALLAQGARLFPQESNYVLRAIYFNHTGGRTEVARELAELGGRWADDAATRQRFERVQKDLAALP